MSEPVLILTYYWPPSGGSGVQRWMYFSKFLPANGFTPYVVTVDEKKASYKFTDYSFPEHVKHIDTTRTNTRELLKLYSAITTGKSTSGIPQAFAGETKPGPIKKLARYIRGNYFIPDARKGWNKFAFKAACALIEKHGIKKIITTGPPHSTHLVGMMLKEKYKLTWLADFRDPWRELYYNNLLYRSAKADKKDADLEKKVLDTADCILTVGPGMKRLLESKITDKDKIKFIYNGYDEELFAHVKHTPLKAGEIVVTHVGLLGEKQPIDAFLNALDALALVDASLKQKLILRIVGGVSEIILDAVKKRAAWLKVEQTGYVKHAEAIQCMVDSHILLNSLPITGKQDYMISGKLMEYIASGRPILALGNTASDAAALLNEHNWCRVFEREDVEGIKTWLNAVIGELEKGNDCAHATGQLVFSRQKTAVTLAQLLKSI